MRLETMDDLKALVGQEIAVSDWLTVTQQIIDAFAAVTHDRQWIHVDTDRARAESPYGTTIAHGFLTLSLLSHLHGSALTFAARPGRLINYGLNRLRFPAPVPAGSRLRSRGTLAACDDQADFLQLTWNITVDIEGTDKPALAAEWLLRLYRS